MPNRPGFSERYPEIMVSGVPTGSLVTIWPKVAPMLEPALAVGETIGDVLTKLYLQEAQLWAIFENGEPLAAVVTEIFTDENGDKIANIWAAGGSGINRWIDYIDMIEDWARDNGCVAIIVEKTRRGMHRLLKGYKVTHVTLGKEL